MPHQGQPHKFGSGGTQGSDPRNNVPVGQRTSQFERTGVSPNAAPGSATPAITPEGVDFFRRNRDKATEDLNRVAGLQGKDDAFGGGVQGFSRLNDDPDIRRGVTNRRAATRDFRLARRDALRRGDRLGAARIRAEAAGHGFNLSGIGRFGDDQANIANSMQASRVDAQANAIAGGGFGGGFGGGGGGAPQGEQPGTPGVPFQDFVGRQKEEGDGINISNQFPFIPFDPSEETPNTPSVPSSTPAGPVTFKDIGVPTIGESAAKSGRSVFEEASVSTRAVANTDERGEQIDVPRTSEGVPFSTLTRDEAINEHNKLFDLIEDPNVISIDPQFHGGNSVSETRTILQDRIDETADNPPKAKNLRAIKRQEGRIRFLKNTIDAPGSRFENVERSKETRKEIEVEKKKLEALKIKAEKFK